MPVTPVFPVAPHPPVVVVPTPEEPLPPQPQGDPSHIPHPPIDMFETPPVDLNPAGIPGPPGEDGEDGEDGAPGANGAGVQPPVAFSYGDVSPIVIYTATAPCVLSEVELLLRVPFDGPGATLSLGSPGDAEAYLPTTYVDPTTAGTYGASPDVDLIAGDQILLYILPGFAPSAGSGKVLVLIANE